MIAFRIIVSSIIGLFMFVAVWFLYGAFSVVFEYLGGWPKLWTVSVMGLIAGAVIGLIITVVSPKG